jgi:ABC-type sugar transport system ATPase subunit
VVIKQVHDSGVTILLVEQNVTFSLRIADRANIMQTGQIVYAGDVPSLDRDKVANYLGVGRLLGTHVEKAARERAAPPPKPKSKRKPKRTVKSRSGKPKSKGRRKKGG